MAQTGQIIGGKFRIEKLIGRGGMSRVYLARDERLNKKWVVKEIRRSRNGQENSFLLDAALSEADIIRSLDHPAVVRIVDIVQDRSAIYIVEDYVEGISLKEYADRGGHVDEKRLKNWAVQMCRVLIYLHSRRPPVIFRDLKPENVILTSSWHLKLVDFGIARRYQPEKTRDTVYLGTELFAAPEQYEENGLQTDMRTDIFGLGRTLEYLAGYSDGVSRRFQAIIRRCVRPDPGERYQDAGELLDELEHYEAHEKRQRSIRTRQILLGITAGVLLLTGISMILSRAGTSYSWDRVQALMETIRDTQTFTHVEEEELLNLIMPKLPDWKEREGFDHIAYEIGMLYWNYYTYGQDRTAGMKASVPWFMIARSYDPSAQVYEMMGDLTGSIQQMAPQGWEKGTYAACYERLRTLLSYVENHEVGDAACSEACRVCADLLASSAEQFREDHIEKDRLEELLLRITQLMNGLQDSTQTEQQRLLISTGVARAEKAVERCYGSSSGIAGRD